ncbi:MAG: hypothetical protein QT04_C0050G0019 [archaeon GW2011_AR11]|nr:MAG: hypothetical protein QT04_C0050G0019 [archaeon GW2011_AR11]
MKMKEEQKKRKIVDFPDPVIEKYRRDYEEELSERAWNDMEKEYEKKKNFEEELEKAMSINYLENPFKKEHNTKKSFVGWQEEVEKNLISWSELILEDIPPISWLIEKIIPVKGVAVISGDSGSCKTYIALLITHSISEGKNFLKKFGSQRGKILYIDEENSLISIRERILKLVSEVTDMEEIYFLQGKNVKLDDDIWKLRLEELIIKIKPRLIVIDSLVRFLQGDENSARDVRKIFETIKYLLDKYDVSFLILHHTTKQGSNTPRKHSMRGSGDLSAFPDTVNMIIKNKNRITVIQDKNRHMEPIPAFDINLIDAEDGSLFFEYQERSGGIRQTKAEQCAEDIKKVVIENNIMSITTDEAKKRFYKKEKNEYDYSYNAIIDALQLLVKKGFFKSEKKGEFARKEEI